MTAAGMNSFGRDVMSANPSNGSSKILWWLLGSFYALSMALGTVLFTGLFSRVEALESISFSREGQVASLISGMGSMTSALNRLEGKIDKVDSKIDSLTTNLGRKGLFRGQ